MQVCNLEGFTVAKDYTGKFFIDFDDKLIIESYFSGMQCPMIARSGTPTDP